ncbi:hypothetical protein GUJ93_ZPchr0002g23368 [Zizania palustris]|uniref:Uncharacterized protein n=1 Tax=Zizania palustris TaxID=103762 RepID=A0A8J5S5I2_ZIZPA|nr:hypothetical protein GUJ93_ZPchr0002g23368 [Zizania palustris]
MSACLVGRPREELGRPDHPECHPIVPQIMDAGWRGPPCWPFSSRTPTRSARFLPPGFMILLRNTFR